MRRILRSFVCLVILTLVVRFAPATAQVTDAPDALEAVLMAEGQAPVLIALRTPTDAAKRSDAPDLDALSAHVTATRNRVLDTLHRTGKREALTITATFSHIHALAGTLHSLDALEALRHHPDVAAVSLDSGGGGGLAESVPLINADRWAEQNVSGAGVRIAILDTGIDTDHSNFTGSIIAQACFLNTGDTSRCPNGTTEQQTGDAAEDDHGHGTHVTGIAAGRGQTGSPGVAPGAEVVAVKVLDAQNRFTSTSEIMRGLNYLITNANTLGIRLVSMSLGTDAQFPGSCNDSQSWTRAGFEAVNTLRALGITVFASSMNKGSAFEMAFPACLSNVIAVGATDKQDQLASYTNRNGSLDILAPGSGIVSSRVGGGLSTLSGTSMAAPHAAGCAALLIAAGLATTPVALRSLIRSSDVIVTDPDFSGRTYRRLDCYSSAIVAADTEAPPEAAHLLQLEAYPNPATDVVRIKADVRTPHTATLTIYDALGRTVYRTTLTGTGAQNQALSTESWAAGLYLVELRTPTHHLRRLLIRQP